MIQRFIAPLPLLLIACVHYVAADPGAALQHYDEDATETAIRQFSCADSGARCLFRRENFASVDFGEGLATQVSGGSTTWASTVPGAVLILGACTVVDPQGSNNDCIVSCNEDCTCAVTLDGDSAPCVEVTSRAPTPVPGIETPIFPDPSDGGSVPSPTPTTGVDSDAVPSADPTRATNETPDIAAVNMDVPSSAERNSRAPDDAPRIAMSVIWALVAAMVMVW